MNARTRNRLLQLRHDALIQEEARIANDIQKQHPDVTRSEALRLASRKALPAHVTLQCGCVVRFPIFAMINDCGGHAPQPDPMEADEKRYAEQHGTGVRRSWAGD